MEFYIDLSAIPTDSLPAFIWWFFIKIGWVFPVFLFFYGLLLMWQNYIRNQVRRTKKYILLAIDVPRYNLQTPRAIQNFFGHLSGAHKPLTWYDRWWFGELKESFSFELISIGGSIQFIIHMEQKYRDFIEAAIYAQYPNAEISEIEDYTQRWNLKFPEDNDEYDVWGTEMVLAAPDYMPIITYQEFVDTISGEIKDPMQGIIETMSRIGPQQELWIQFVVTPADNDWGDKAKSAIKKMIGEKAEKKKSPLAPLFDFFTYTLESIFYTPPESAGGDSGGEQNKLNYMTEGEKQKVSAIEYKINKTGFHVRTRLIYIGRKDNFDKVLGANAVIGSFKQFNTLGYNAFKPDSSATTGSMVWFKKQRMPRRKNNILASYKDRGHSLSEGEYGGILNSEELASLWHFPISEQAQAASVKTTDAKRVEGPSSLPVESPAVQRQDTVTGSPTVTGTNNETPSHEVSPPDNLPFG